MRASTESHFSVDRRRPLNKNLTATNNSTAGVVKISAEGLGLIFFGGWGRWLASGWVPLLFCLGWGGWLKIGNFWLMDVEGIQHSSRVVVSNVLYFHPYLGKMNPFWRSYFSIGLQPPTSHFWGWKKRSTLPEVWKVLKSYMSFIFASSWAVLKNPA